MADTVICSFINQPCYNSSSRSLPVRDYPTGNDNAAGGRDADLLIEYAPHHC